MSSSQSAPQGLSDMRTPQSLETNQPKSQQSMDPQKPPETADPQMELRGGGACDGRLCGIIPCPIPINCWIIPCPC
ncbi:hypothetical protein LB506_005503 [Fusarium annulatum]|uniref:Uncharacterized protein n=2 Tax=Gibberella intermedia TaxID=948311 RepID=A0A1L7VBQ5_FUSPR|nr:uncharacterized protein FPRO_06672 [Fusarium proliferatum ET1]KAI1063608.1 hypothetical protein LB506_005503 [Fusarium annulatum]RKL50562.1 hypothetical protein BFJ72_g15 [Fusarium proliferatum]CZR38137.1 uncharacterized protein FPRO_06672 [Fusarium proliferatum ET1]